MNTYHRQLAATIAIDTNENLRKLIQAAVESWQIPGSHDSSQPVKQPQSGSQSRQVQGILVLSRRPMPQKATQTLLQQIIAQQTAQGHSWAKHCITRVSTAGKFWDDKAYAYAAVREEFSNLGGPDLADRTLVFPFQATDGNVGKYFVVFDRP